MGCSQYDLCLPLLLLLIRTGNAGGDDDNVGSRKRLLHSIIGGEVAFDFGDGGDVGQIGGNTGSVDDIVEGEVVDLFAGLEEERQRLGGG